MSELTYLPSTRFGVLPEPRGPLIEIAIPVYNEEHVLAASVRRLHAYLIETFPYRFVITVVDNASTDRTWEIASQLSLEIPEVEAVRLSWKGRGRALRHVWGTSSAEVVAYMDVDLSTDLHAFLPLIAPLVSGHSDLAIGSRLTRGSAVSAGSGGQRGGTPGGGDGPERGEVSSQLISYLTKHRDGATWIVAVASAQSASSIILQTGEPVIAMGGFTGSDPAMTVRKLQEYVRAGKLHYVLTGGGGPGGGGSSSVTSWVTKNCSAVKTSDYAGGSSSAQNTQALYRCG